MSDPIAIFFDTWAITADNARREKMTGAVSDNIFYADPKTPDGITGIDAVNDYVGMFSASAPGWSASVTKSDSIGNVTRVTVAFSGPGPDGRPPEDLDRCHQGRTGPAEPLHQRHPGHGWD